MASDMCSEYNQKKLMKGGAIEWISYDRFKDVKQIGRGEFGTMHMLGGLMDQLMNEILKIKNGRDCKYEVEIALKKFDNFVNFNDILNEQIYDVELSIIYRDFILETYYQSSKTQENFERELEELTKSMSDLCPGDSGIIGLDISNLNFI
ncbi:hypothetical protein Glove_21g242 [Diversispora epigaea]|uniref:Protein kinase domain-containing protein n=1 Tax=Diversispora epigaea TaxID=1348612 RepID=A0A397JMR8_9GLOM|nr:hypothetical protein Glove_21g242 [Diversispora epigaea]